MVDPQRDVEQYVADAAAVCCEVKYVFLTHFAALMLANAERMSTKAGDATARLPILMDDNAGPTCRRDRERKLHITSPRAMLLGIVGLGVAVPHGMFGVGGGFILVPAPVMFSGMVLQRAIGTSLLVITLRLTLGDQG